MDYRIEKDSMWEVQVPAKAYFWAQTQRSVNNFKIWSIKMPLEIICAHAYVKQAAAKANLIAWKLSEDKYRLIALAAQEIIDRQLDDQFPLVVFQTWSGTQTNMNVNEVIANRGHILNGWKLEDNEKSLHPNDDVNKSQSTNDTFPSSIHIATYKTLKEKTLPALKNLEKSFSNKAEEFRDIVKIWRTHLMDATPLTLWNVFSSYAHQLKDVIEVIYNSLEHLSYLPLWWTAVWSGLNTPENYSENAIMELNNLTWIEFKCSKNRFAHMAWKDALAEVSWALKVAAIALMKIWNDIRLLGSWPRCWIWELILPANEPWSSIMPWKVNPTQCEALTQVCTQVIWNDTAITAWAMSGQFELNVFMPVIWHNLIMSAKILWDACECFKLKCADWIQVNKKQIADHLKNSLMLVTALNPHIWYENAAKIAKKAYEEDKTLKQAALKLELLSETEFDEIVDPGKMV